MSKFAQFDAQNELIARYDSEIHGNNIPVEAVEVPDALFWRTINEQDGLWTRDPATGAITKQPFPGPTLAKVKADRITYIEEQYETREHADILYMGATFQAGDEPQKLIDRVLAAQNGTAPAGFGWYDITNTKVPMTNAELQGLANAIFLRNQPLFDNKQAKKAAIRAVQPSATAVAEVGAITW